MHLSRFLGLEHFSGNAVWTFSGQSISIGSELASFLPTVPRVVDLQRRLLQSNAMEKAFWSSKTPGCC